MIQYAYAKHALARGESGHRLLERAAFGVAGRSEAALAGLQGYHVLRSKLFWAGVALLALGVGLCGVTIYVITHPLPQ